MLDKANSALIEVESLRLGYGETVILDSLNFQIQKGEVFVILGGSGCGKSTLLKHLIGLYEPQAGNVSVRGVSVLGSGVSGDPEKVKQMWRSQFGVTYQGGALFASMTLLQNVCLPLKEFRRLNASAREAIGRLKLRLVGLESYCHYLPAEISGGMQKRVAIARAMALDPEILFLDEPSAGLDPLTSFELDQLILKLAKSLGMTFVIVTHELSSIFRIADRVIILDKESKGILAMGNPHELREKSPIKWVRDFLQAGDRPSHV